MIWQNFCITKQKHLGNSFSKGTFHTNGTITTWLIGSLLIATRSKSQEMVYKIWKVTRYWDIIVATKTFWERQSKTIKSFTMKALRYKSNLSNASKSNLHLQKAHLIFRHPESSASTILLKNISISTSQYLTRMEKV